MGLPPPLSAPAFSCPWLAWRVYCTCMTNCLLCGFLPLEHASGEEGAALGAAFPLAHPLSHLGPIKIQQKFPEPLVEDGRLSGRRQK